MGFKSGFVTIVGRANVGKSTLTNAIMGEKIVIMSDKPQTTRNNTNAIYMGEESQIIFIDTPGLHKPKNKLGDYMVNSATKTLKEVDAIIYIADNSTKIGPGDLHILELLSSVKTPVILAVNKSDLTTPDQYVQIVENYQKFDCIKEIISISAANNQNVDQLLKIVEKYIPEGPMLYPDDILTDKPLREIVSEIVREKLLMYLDQEVPHGVAVEVESMKHIKKKQMWAISATIICERSSHKGIVIGKNGRKLKGVGKAARQDLEKLLDAKVFLELWVKARPGWRDNDTQLKSLGYKAKK